MQKVAKIISAVTNPKILMGATLIIPSLWYGSFIIPIITIIVTVVVRVWEHLREGEDEASFKNENARQVRYQALVLGVILFLLAAGAAYVTEMDVFLIRFYLTTAMTLLVMLVLTAVFKSRLSLHTATLGLILYFINGIFGSNQFLLVLIAYLSLLPFVGWSRILLGKHTIAQILVTMAVTIICLIVTGVF